MIDTNETTFADRDFQAAQLALLVALAEKLTGQKVIVQLKNAHGFVVPIGADPEMVRFESRRETTASRAHLPEDETRRYGPEPALAAMP